MAQVAPARCALRLARAPMLTSTLELIISCVEVNISAENCTGSLRRTALLDVRCVCWSMILPAERILRVQRRTWPRLSQAPSVLSVSAALAAAEQHTDSRTVGCLGC